MNRLLNRLPLLLTLAIATAMLLHGPIPQWPHYHDFADRRTWLGLPNAADVLSNAGFALVATWALFRLWPLRRHAALAPGWPGYALFLATLILTALGSTYYHLAPDDARLVWDRLPIALACAGLIAAVRGETRPATNTRAWTLLLSVTAVASVAWWRYTGLYGEGDLRPYLLVQGLPLLLIPLWQWIHRAPRADRTAFASALALYALAKAAELYDHELLALLGIFSGHTLKHLLATAAALVLAQRLVQRATARQPGEPDEMSAADFGYRIGKRRGTMMRALIRAVLRLIARLLFRVRVRGDTGHFQADRLLIIANHESLLDGLLIGLFLPVDPVFVVHTGVVANPWFRLLLRGIDYLAMDPTNPMGMKRVVKLIESGRPVVIFPEGRITVTGSLMKVYDGPAFAAAKTHATVVPVRLDGPARSYFSRLSGRYPRRLLPRITLTVLPPTQLDVALEGTAKQRRRAAGEAMRRLMQEMLFASRPTQTLFSALCDAIEIHGRRRGVIEDIRQIEYSYQDLLKMTLMLGRLAVRESGSRAEGERIGVLLPNITATLALLLGLTAQNRVPAMLNYSAGPDALKAACDAAQIRTIITSRVFVDQAKLAESLHALAAVRVLYLEDLRATATLADKLWLMVYAIWLPRWVDRSGSPEDAAVVLFTSGSEGKPKGVVLPHRAILANIVQVRAVVDFSTEDKFLNALPIFHSFGLTGGALLPVLTGCRLFLYPSPLHYKVIPEVAYDRSCTVLFGTSTFLGNYAKSAHPYDFFRLRYVVAGAEKLAEPVRQLWFEKFGLRILEGYGATETAPVLAVNTPMAYRTGTVGQCLPGVEHRLVPVPGIECGGELHVRGPNVMAGYLRVERPGVIQPPASELGPGWYATGDVVEVDDDGFLHIVGRLKRFAKIAGEMVSLEVAEKIAATAAPEMSHAVTTQPDPQKGEALVLFTTDPELDRDALLAAARTLGATELAVPRKIVSVDALPLLGTGKTDYVTLKKWAETAA